MIPSNRRVAKPQLPPDVLGDEFEESEPLTVSEPPSVAPPPAAAPPSRFLVGFMAVIRVVLSVLLVVSVAGGLAWSTRRYVRESPRFALTNVAVSGNHHRSEAEILERAGLALGQNVFALDLADVKEKLSSDPWLREVTLSRRLPGTVLVHVIEREPAALVGIGDTVYLAARDGEIWKRLEASDPVDMPIVTGLRADAVLEDRDGVVLEIKRALDLVAEYGETSLSAKAPLQQAHVGDDGAMTLVVGKSGLSLSLGKPPYRRRLEQAVRVVAELERRMGPRALTEKADSIMLDSDARPDRVVVRMR
ncbi:MAG: FtsQ-type POTRA domain-containing protein [Myxococcales bacterium]|nr:FtsQ-type POTRA domain-containing protein [Myxococcales bacterium]